MASIRVAPETVAVLVRDRLLRDKVVAALGSAVSARDDRRRRVRGELHAALRVERSTDLIRPIVATWVRSSSGSPRLRKRRARCSTSGRRMRTSWLRISAYSGAAVLQLRAAPRTSPAPRCGPRARTWGAGVCCVPGTLCSPSRSCSLIVPPVALCRALASARPRGRAPSRLSRGEPARLRPADARLHGGTSRPPDAAGPARGCRRCRRPGDGNRPEQTGPAGARPAGSSRVPRSSSRTGPSPFLTPARVPRRAVCRG